MKVQVRRFVIATAAGATILSGLGIGAVASAGGRERPAKVTTVAEQRHEAEVRGRIAEGETQAGDDRGRQAEARGRVAEGEREMGDDRGQNRGPDAHGRNRGPGGGAEDQQGQHGRGADDGPNHDRGDDHGNGR